MWFFKICYELIAIFRYNKNTFFKIGNRCLMSTYQVNYNVLNSMYYNITYVGILKGFNVYYVLYILIILKVTLGIFPVYLYGIYRTNKLIPSLSYVLFQIRESYPELIQRAVVFGAIFKPGYRFLGEGTTAGQYMKSWYMFFF